MASHSPQDEISESIRQEINRFESVHPSIYAIYDLIDAIEDKSIAALLRKLVVSIEDSFVNSQEWTVSHNVPEIKLGLLGSVHSGKSALVHRYLTGAYLREDSPEGGRFKKEVSLENQSYLLLIRDEGGPPDEQFSQWVDGVIFVFSLENVESYQTVYEYFSCLSNYRLSSALPILLVGTQDSCGEPYVRLIDDAMARKLANDLKRCPYHETCAAYGLNVERVFQDACIKILQSRNCSISPLNQFSVPPYRPNATTIEGSWAVASNQLSQGCGMSRNLPVGAKSTTCVAPTGVPSVPDKSSRNLSIATPSTLASRRVDVHNSASPDADPCEETKTENDIEPLTPSSTPTHSRKSKRKSNLFQQKKGDDDKDRDKKVNGIGVGRAIPLKQGFLYKRSSKPLSKEWRTKKYVTLTDDARLTYHPSIHDYMENTHGKEIDLSRITVKIPGVAFRQVGGGITSNGLLRSQLADNNLDKKDAGQNLTGSPDSVPTDVSALASKDSSSSVKKRHRRIKSNLKGAPTDGYDSEGYEFQLISMDRQWHFEASGSEERDDWILRIERAILTRLQLNESNKRTKASTVTSANVGLGPGIGSVSNNRSTGDNNSLTSARSDTNEVLAAETLTQNILAAAGNDFCADCGAPEPEWASLNLGAMLCIGCSGIHRQLGTHISRVRSLHLDDWSPELAAVMCAIGNTLANSVWEAAVPVNAGNRKKPVPSSSREEIEAWIRAKYELQEFLPPLPYPDSPLQRQLIDAIARQDTRQVILCLALATRETVNAPYSRQDPRAAIHIAATLGNLVYLQLLLWYNGDATITDHEGRNAFYYAHCSQKYDCADFLLRSGCPKQLVPPGTNVSTGRMIQPQIQQQTYPLSSHGAFSGPLNAPLDPMVTAHGSSVGQPHHFSHLQQQQPPFPPPSSCPTFPSHISNHPGTLGAAVCTMNAPSHPVTNLVSAPNPSYHGFVGSTHSGTPSSGMSPAIGHQQQLPTLHVGYNPTSNINPGIGATLPRRRTPSSVATPGQIQPVPRPVSQQQKQQQQQLSGSANTQRPPSVVTRISHQPPPPPHHVPSSYTRSISNSNSPSSPSGAALPQAYSTTVNSQEVGL